MDRQAESSDGGDADNEDCVDLYEHFDTPPVKSFMRSNSRLRHMQSHFRRSESSRMVQNATPRGGLERVYSKNQRQRARQQERQFKVWPRPAPARTVKTGHKTCHQTSSIAFALVEYRGSCNAPVRCSCMRFSKCLL